MPTRAEQLQQTYDGLVQTGRLLVSSVDGVLMPSAVSDDLGLYLFAPPLARAAGVEPVLAASWLLIGLLIVSALVGLAGWLLVLESVVAKAEAFVAVAALAALAGFRGDVYVASVAVLLAGVPWTILLWRRRPPTTLLVGATVALGTWAGLCNLFRAHSGTTLLVFAVTGTIALAAASRRWKLTLLLGLIVGLLLVSLPVGALIESRSSYLSDKQESAMIERAGHPFWHTAYIGLGFLSNPYGISYSDTIALDEARRHTPDVVYLSEEYESILRRSYFRVALEHPVFFASTLAAKAGVLLAMLLVVAGWAIPLALRYPKPLNEDVAFGAALLFAALPGIVATPVIEYLTGLVALAALWTVSTVGQWQSHKHSTGA